MPFVLQLATQFNISAYDAQFVTLAQAATIPLITEDRKLLTLFPEQAFSMNDFLAR
jgi:predicted nucleic acid-binding protein